MTSLNNTCTISITAYTSILSCAMIEALYGTCIIPIMAENKESWNTQFAATMRSAGISNCELINHPPTNSPINRIAIAY